eukprot:TRINITY_DN18976_c0_g1_i2.p1 TRINITY_DN18976_c0_g1~~TRINITY_DN18976_c0_g1_i2.p1  ORF type:complete len:244 (+),score=84.23 TRINITY_DN18976_c0_g1_i2:117-848(+)
MATLQTRRQQLMGDIEDVDIKLAKPVAERLRGDESQKIRQEAAHYNRLRLQKGALQRDLASMNAGLRNAQEDALWDAEGDPLVASSRRELAAKADLGGGYLPSGAIDDLAEHGYSQVQEYIKGDMHKVMRIFAIVPVDDDRSVSCQDFAKALASQPWFKMMGLGLQEASAMAQKASRSAPGRLHFKDFAEALSEAEMRAATHQRKAQRAEGATRAAAMVMNAGKRGGPLSARRQQPAPLAKRG